MKQCEKWHFTVSPEHFEMNSKFNQRRLAFHPTLSKEAGGLAFELLITTRRRNRRTDTIPARPQQRAFLEEDGSNMYFDLAGFTVLYLEIILNWNFLADLIYPRIIDNGRTWSAQEETQDYKMGNWGFCFFENSNSTYLKLYAP